MAFHGTAPLAALTTVFTPPCPTSWLVTTSKLPSQFPLFPPAGPVPTCNPPNWQDNLAAEGFQFYSPAICPSGFQVGPGCVLTTTPRTTEGFPDVAPGETVAWCVPSGHSCTSDTTDFRGGYWGVTRTATETGALATVGPAMQIRFRDSDLSILETHPLTPGLTLAGLPTQLSTPSEVTTILRSPSPTAASEPDAAASKPSASATVPTMQFQTPRRISTLSMATSASSTTTTPGTLVTASPRPPKVSGIDSNSASNSDSENANSAVPASNSSGSDSAASAAGATSTGATMQHHAQSHTRAFTATVTMSCLLGVMSVGIAAFFLVTRRRRRLRQTNQQAARDAEQGEDAGAAAGSSSGSSGSPGSLPGERTGLALFSKMFSFAQPAATTPSNGVDGHGAGLASHMSSVGVGVWVQRRDEQDENEKPQHQKQRPRHKEALSRAKEWWAGLPFVHREQEEQQSARGTVDPAATRLPPLECSLAAEKLGANGRCSPGYCNADDVDSDFDEEEAGAVTMHGAKGIPSRPRGDRSTARQSWMSRLSKYMRGGEQGRHTASSADGRTSPNSNSNSSSNTPTNGSGTRSTRGNRDTRDARDEDGSSVGRASTRWSRGTRADTLSIVTDGADYAGQQPRGLSDPNSVKADSWEAFARSHQGLGKVLAARKIKQIAGPSAGGAGGCAGSAGGPASPANTDTFNALPSSPTTTVRSDRTSVRRGSRWLSVDSKQLSRLSNGTFGRMDSFVSKAGSASSTAETPSAREAAKKEGTTEDSAQKEGAAEAST